MPQRSKTFTFNGRQLEVRVEDDGAEWAAWVYDGDRRVAKGPTAELEAINELTAGGDDPLGKMIAVTISSVQEGKLSVRRR